jgi:hypothetical protein
MRPRLVQDFERKGQVHLRFDRQQGKGQTAQIHTDSDRHSPNAELQLARNPCMKRLDVTKMVRTPEEEWLVMAFWEEEHSAEDVDRTAFGEPETEHSCSDQRTKLVFRCVTTASALPNAFSCSFGSHSSRRCLTMLHKTDQFRLVSSKFVSFVSTIVVGARS